MTDSQTLLAEYARQDSEAAFRELVVRYIDFVFSTALRLAGGDTNLAEDIAQTVFIDLARQAKEMSKKVKLGGWLHRHTCFVAAKTMRGERRRQLREKAAVEMNAPEDHSQARLAEAAPILDTAINELGAMDREAVLLRFYERLDFRAVGQALGVSEGAAQKRVERALEKLHVLLKRHGVTLTVVGLGTALGGAVTAAPVGLANGIAGMALANAAVQPGLFGALKIMASNKLKTSAVAAAIAASILTPLLLQHQAQARLAEQNETWRNQSNQIAALTAENQRLAALVANSANSRAASNSDFRELIRLRGEAGVLRDKVRRMTASTEPPAFRSPQNQIAWLTNMYGARITLLKDWLDAHPSQNIPELRYVTNNADWLVAIGNELLETDESFRSAAWNVRSTAQDYLLDRLLFPALHKYGADNHGQFPTALDQLRPYLASPINEDILQRYEIVPTANLVPGGLRPHGDWAITEVAPADPGFDWRDAIGLTDSGRAGPDITNLWTFVP